VSFCGNLEKKGEEFLGIFEGKNEKRILKKKHGSENFERKKGMRISGEII
jgi:hypothetical protein